MKKHALCYTLLILTIVVMAGQITAPKNADVNLAQPKTVIVEPEDYKSIKRDLKNTKSELEKKDLLIAKLNARINEKISEVEKIKHAKLEDIKPIEEKKKNPLIDLLSSAGNSADNPKVKEFMKKNILKRYASLFNKLNLSEEQKEQLAQLIMDRDKQKQQKLMELLSQRSSGDKFDAEAFKELANQTEADEEIKELLGNDYEDFTYHEQTAFERRQMNEINTSLSEGDKLSSNQEDKLVSLLKKRNDDMRTGNKQSDEEYIAESSEFLNEKQSEELGKSLKRNNSSFGGLPFINGSGGGGNIQVIESIQIDN